MVQITGAVFPGAVTFWRPARSGRKHSRWEFSRDPVLDQEFIKRYLRFRTNRANFSANCSAAICSFRGAASERNAEPVLIAHPSYTLRILLDGVAQPQAMRLRRPGRTRPPVRSIGA